VSGQQAPQSLLEASGELFDKGRDLTIRSASLAERFAFYERKAALLEHRRRRHQRRERLTTSLVGLPQIVGGRIPRGWSASRGVNCHGRMAELSTLAYGDMRLGRHGRLLENYPVP